jgi:hypothetical protein
MTKRKESDNCEELIDIQNNNRYISDDEFALNRLDIDDIDDSQDNKDNKHYIIDAVDSEPTGDSIILYDFYGNIWWKKRYPSNQKRINRDQVWSTAFCASFFMRKKISQLENFTKEALARLDGGLFFFFGS